ncbi:hypothetical protein ACFL1L_00100 [Thermoplasmatota archaeon]
MVNSDLGIGLILRLPLVSFSSKSFILIHFISFTCPFSSPTISKGATRYSSFTPSASVSSISQSGSAGISSRVLL